jgi:hypothetical protein
VEARELFVVEGIGEVAVEPVTFGEVAADGGVGALAGISLRDVVEEADERGVGGGVLHGVEREHAGGVPECRGRRARFGVAVGGVVREGRHPRLHLFPKRLNGALQVRRARRAVHIRGEVRVSAERPEEVHEVRRLDAEGNDVLHALGLVVPHVGQVGLPDPIPLLLVLAVVEARGKVGREAGVERTLTEEAGTEGVDGADEAAWQHSDCLRHALRFGCGGVRVVRQLPLGRLQLAVEARPHLAGGLSSEGDRRAVVERHAGAHQRDHAPDEGGGFAGSWCRGRTRTARRGGRVARDRFGGEWTRPEASGNRA